MKQTKRDTTMLTVGIIATINFLLTVEAEQALSDESVDECAASMVYFGAWITLPPGHPTERNLTTLAGKRGYLPDWKAGADALNAGVPMQAVAGLLYEECAYNEETYL